MPAALKRVERSARLLEDASSRLKVDPCSAPARKLLIEGSGGILQVFETKQKKTDLHCTFTDIQGVQDKDDDTRYVFF